MATDAPTVFDQQVGVAYLPVCGSHSIFFSGLCLLRAAPKDKKGSNMGRIFKIEAVAPAMAGEDLRTALLKAKTSDVLAVPHSAMNLTVAGGIVEIEQEGMRDEI